MCYNIFAQSCLADVIHMTLSVRSSTSTKTRRAAHNKPGRSRATRQPGLKNRQALKLLATWMSTPDDRGADWWQQFEHDLAETRLSFRAE